jgi:hypothetical protein
MKKGKISLFSNQNITGVKKFTYEFHYVLTIIMIAMEMTGGN